MKRWQGPGGYAHVLRIGLPLLAGMGSITAMHVTDRLFLGWFSQDALAAAVSAGAVFFLLTSLFLGTAGYASVLIAQNVGAGKPKATGSVLWQGIYFALLSFVPLVAMGLAARPLFTAMDHPPAVREIEIVYYRLLMFGAGFMVLEAALSSFFNGRGLTRVAMVVNLGGALLNIPLNYVLIFGALGIPPLGVAGSAVATVAAWAIMATVYAVLIFTRANDRCFSVWRDWRPRRAVFATLVRLGAPGGAQIFLDVFAAAFFIALAGRMGTVELGATGIVLAANAPAFLPLIGLSQGLAVVVGQSMGGGRPDVARRAAGSAMRIFAVYVSITVVLFLTLPGPLADLFQPRQADADFAAARALCRPLFVFAALFGITDIVNHTVFGVLRGSGDTRFLMLATAALSLGGLVVPAWAAVTFLGAGIITLWALFSGYSAMLAVVLWLRYRAGTWQKIRLVDPEPAEHP